jgi:hypothetical protein
VLDMADLDEFDDPGPLFPERPGRLRRGLTIALLITLIVSMVYLAFISGRGVVPIRRVVPPTRDPQSAIARPVSPDPVVELAIRHVEREDVSSDHSPA